MIKSIKIKGLLVHKNTSLIFHPGVNVIVGPSGSGKTSLIRAIRLLAFNKPSGNNLIRKGAKKLYVAIKVKGHLIERIKGRGVNQYILDGEKWTNPGTSVPAPVSRVLKLNDINIKNQFDQQYILSETPGQVAKRINQLVNLDKIDRVLEYISKRLRSKGRQLNVIEDRIKVVEADLDGLQWAKQAKIDIEKIERLYNGYQYYEQTIDKIEECLELKNEIENDIKEDKKLIRPIEKVLSTCENNLEKAEACERKITRIEILLEKIQSDSWNMDILKKQIRTIESELSQIDTCPLCGQEVNNEDSFLR